MEEIRTEEEHPLGRIRADNDRKFRKKIHRRGLSEGGFLGKNLAKTLSGAFRTHAFYHIIDGVRTEALGDFHHGHFHGLEAEGLLAALAIEMDVLVVGSMVGGTRTQLIFERTAAVLHHVYDVLLCKELKDAEDAGLVHGEMEQSF